MRVTELRKLLEKYNKDDLSKMMIELYKAIPKKVRDEKAIDMMLEDFQQYKEAGKIKRSKAKHVDLNDLEQEITELIQNAYKQNYIAPNRYVSKKERPKWRFKVKSYIKQLQQIPVEGNEGKRATDLLEKLYEMLCYGCGYYIFNTDNPFRSIGMEQVELFDIILKRKFSMGIGTPILGSVYSPVRRLVIGMAEVVDSYIHNRKLKQWDFGYC